MDLPPNAADNAPLRRWPAPGPQYENWYGLVNHPTRRFAFWFRYTLLSTSTGVQEARVWAIPVDGDAADRTRVITAAMPVDAFRVEQAPWRLRFGDVGTLGHGEVKGAVADERGRIEWSLHFKPACPSVVAVASPLVRKLIGTSSHRSPNSSIRVSGTLSVDGETIEFNNATAHQGHTEGTRMQPTWVWGRAGGFENADDAFFEGVAVERGGRRMGSFTVHAAGRTFALNRVAHLRGRMLGLLGGANETEWQVGQWRLQGEQERRKIVATLNATGHTPARLRYMDTDGKPKFISMFALSSCALSITPAISGPHVSTTLLSKGKANMEFASPTPLVGDADDYLPRF